MDAPTQETPEEFEARRRAAEDLAAAVRELADAAVGTAVDAAAVRDTADAVRALAARLGTRTTDDPYADLVRRPVDPAVPQDPMPINPIIGDCSPTRPDVTLGYRDGEVHGRAYLTRRFTGPPGFAHGGITAMLADFKNDIALFPMRKKFVEDVLSFRLNDDCAQLIVDKLF